MRKFALHTYMRFRAKKPSFVLYIHTCEKMRKYAKICEKVRKCAKMCENVRKCAKMCEKMRNNCEIIAK